MEHDIQQAQQNLIEQALADQRIAAAVRAYDAVRPFVPEPVAAPVATTYTAATRITASTSREG